MRPIVFALAAAIAAQAQDGTLLISDFEGDKAETRSGLAFVIYADEQFGGTSEARTSLIRPGANASRGAVRITFHVTDDFPTPFAGAWVMMGDEGLATDLSAYRGIRFYARSQHAAAFSAGVVRFPGRVTRYAAPFDVKPEWTVIDVPFERFREIPPPGAPASNAPLTAPKDVTSIGFSVVPKLRGQFELDVDRIEVYR